MKNAIKLLVLGLIQYVFMFLFVLLLPTDTFVSYNIITLEMMGIYSKWNELIFLLIPLLIIFGYIIECFLNTRNENMTGKPYKMKKIVKYVCLSLFSISSLLCWVGLVIQSKFAHSNFASQPYFFIFTFVVAIILIVVGKYLLKAKRGECVGINIPLLTRDHSIWRRVNYLMGLMMITSGIVLIFFMVIYELLLNTVFAIIGIVLVILLSFIVPFAYCLYLNYKTKK